MPATLDAIGKSDVMGRDGFTWWVGEVEDIEDPQNLGRTKVRIIGWYTGAGNVAYTKDMPTEDLPWAVTMLPTDQAGIKNSGTKCELQVGAQVLGFFLDGEEAQLPVVMGSLRGFKNNSKDGAASTEAETGATVVADPKKALPEEEMPPQAKSLQGEVVHGGSPFNVVGGEQAGDEHGGEEKSRGVISIAEVRAPGNVYTNPIKIPADAFAVGDGLSGPAGIGFEQDLKRMLNEFGQLSGSIARGSGGDLISIISGGKISNKQIQTSLDGIKTSVSNAISGIMSSLKNVLAQGIESMVSSLLGALTNVIPLGIITQLMKLATFITSLFCNFEANYILGAISGALGDITSFANDIAGNVVDKVVGGLATKVNDTVNGVLSKVQGAVGKVAAMGQKVMAAINVAKGGLSMVSKLKSLFSFDFSKMNWSSLISIIIGLLKMLFGNKDCGRGHKAPKQKFWLPLLGTSTCETVPEFLQQEIEIGGASDLAGEGNYTTKGDYFSQLMEGINPYKVCPNIP
tara:strand:+ start:6251 stop:7795 length:1545 start_codon:yes stop_codon:yes gene_type:complete